MCRKSVRKGSCSAHSREPRCEVSTHTPGWCCRETLTKTVNPCIESLQEKLDELHAERLAMGYFAAPTLAQEQEAENLHSHYLDIISNMLNSMERETKSLYVTSP